MTLNALRLQQTRNEVGDAKEALWREVQESLPLAVAHCREGARKARESGEVQFDPIPIRKNPELARQVQALLGVDLFRELIEEDTGMRFMLAACCAPVIGPRYDLVREKCTWEMQFLLQSNEIYMC
ncbi:hypothetical protein COU20_00840 [Candidatus Kaiserbacteria bacterium CG10_big_fil_rev_8_21_14_0_10_59_10]|uniref:Uncharacterized protein n=1 Tax=Candidatus Kaiserbacteria bacterium CG10_big_fil_rev_8_21_14_0_10_59_10 TaxID=1974612 RepID=A0A2H0U8H2_9BACT|nr:MAG: hypothetical protein COU20_00840 [Candidatus Kaiserbacteria bacterium CG10_big_fil_rev_8_21_14_0_10_59_10]